MFLFTNATKDIHITLQQPEQKVYDEVRGQNQGYNWEELFGQIEMWWNLKWHEETFTKMEMIELEID